MKVIDISRTIHPGMELYPGDRAPEITRVSTLEQGHPYNLSEITMGTHTGTHVDPPYHYVIDGFGTDALPMGSLIGPAVVRDVSAVGRPLEPGDINQVNEKIILLKGRRGGVNLTAATAQNLVDMGIVTIGTEALSIGAQGEESEVHQIFLGAGIIIIEGLDLSNVKEGAYILACLPLKIAGGDGGPARAVLITDI